MVGRVTGGVEYSRPLSTGWSGSLGLTWQRSGCTDDKGVPQTKASRLWAAWDVAHGQTHLARVLEVLKTQIC